MQNKTLINIGRTILKDLIKYCSQEEQNYFKLIYSKNQSLDINIIVDNIDSSRIDFAITQVENTINKRYKS